MIMYINMMTIKMHSTVKSFSLCVVVITTLQLKANYFCLLKCEDLLLFLSFKLLNLFENVEGLTVV